MALLTKRPFADVLLNLGLDGDMELSQNHILEPEFHQDLYREAAENAKASSGAFRIGDLSRVIREPNRGRQPEYIDDESDAESLIYQGMIDRAGKSVAANKTDNVCALKSVAVRWGFVDFGVARSVSKEFFKKHSARAGVQKHDLLINSTGDGTIGRAAIYNREHKAVVDGHITIVRFKDHDYAWYTAAYLLSEQGQRQIYRYINGSSGQVEIYPQDISRLWIPVKSPSKVRSVADKFRAAVKKYEEFDVEMTAMLAMV